MVIDVIVDQLLLGLLKRLDYSLDLLGNRQAVTSLRHHADNGCKMAFGAAQPLEDVRVICAIYKVTSYPPGPDQATTQSPRRVPLLAS